MATIRPKDLPAAASVTATDAFIVDSGATVSKATPAQIVDAAIPLASQAEAEAGADNVKRVTPLRVKQAMDANMATTAALASTATGKGAEMVGFIQTGTGAADRTVEDKLLEVAASVEDFTDTGDTFATALLKAATAHHAIRLAESASYQLPAMVDLSALAGRRIYMNGATISAAAGFADLHMLQVAGDVQIIGPGTFDGTNVPKSNSATFPTTAVNISGITKANPAVVTTATAHGFKPLEVVEFASVGGMTELNFATNGSTRYVVLSTPTPTTFTLGSITSTANINSTGYGTYTSGGTVTRKLDYNAAGFPGVGLFISAGSGGLLKDLTFENFQSGPILNDSRSGNDYFRVIRCSAQNVQLDTVAQVNPVFSITNGTRCKYQDCSITTYNWKGFFFGSGTRCVMDNCNTDGGVTGHASHYLNGGKDNLIINCSQSGVGFGAKVTGSLRPTIRNFSLSSGGFAAVFVYGCTDFTVDGITSVDPVAAVVYAHSFAGFPLFRGVISNVRGVRSTPGTTSNHVGVEIKSEGGAAVTDVTVRDCHFVNMLWTVYAPKGDAAQTGINILNNTNRIGGQYGILAYIGSGRIAGNTIEMDGVAVAGAITVAGDGVTTAGTLEIDDNQISGCTGDNIQIGAGFNLAYRSISVTRNRGAGGTKFLAYLGNQSSTDTVSVLEISGNEFSGLTTGCALTFNTTTSTKFRMQGNNFVNSSFAKVNSTWTNLTNVTFMGWDVQSGTITLTAGTGTVPIPLSEPDTSYRVTLGGSAGESFSWASKTTTQFTVNSSNGSSTATVNWMLTR